MTVSMALSSLKTCGTKCKGNWSITRTASKAAGKSPSPARWPASCLNTLVNAWCLHIPRNAVAGIATTYHKALKSGEQRPGSWRVPAREIESLIARSARHIVAGEVTELLDLAGFRLIVSCKRLADMPEAMRGFDDDGVLNILVKKVELASDGVNLTLDLTSLVHDVSKQNQDLTVTRHLPVAIKRRGVEMRLSYPK